VGTEKRSVEGKRKTSKKTDLTKPRRQRMGRRNHADAKIVRPLTAESSLKLWTREKGENRRKKERREAQKDAVTRKDGHQANRSTLEVGDRGNSGKVPRMDFEPASKGDHGEKTKSVPAD